MKEDTELSQHSEKRERERERERERWGVKGRGEACYKHEKAADTNNRQTTTQ